MAMEQEGMKREEARKRIWMTDSKGLLTVDRPKGGVDNHKALYAKKANHLSNLDDIVDLVKPSCIIGIMIDS